MATLMFLWSPFLKVGGLVGPPYHNFRSITALAYLGSIHTERQVSAVTSHQSSEVIPLTPFQVRRISSTVQY